LDGITEGKTGKKFLIIGNIFHRLELCVQGSALPDSFVPGGMPAAPMVSRPPPVRRKIPIFLEEKTKNLQNGFPRNTLPNAQSAAPRNGMTATADHPGEISRTGITVRFPIRSPKRGSRIPLNIPQNAGFLLSI